VHKRTLFLQFCSSNIFLPVSVASLILKLISNIKAFVSQQNAVIHSDMGPVLLPPPDRSATITCDSHMNVPYLPSSATFTLCGRRWPGGWWWRRGLAPTQISFRKEMLLKSLNDISNDLTVLTRRVISVSRMFYILFCWLYQAVGRKLH
jgi:hypothetical protein